MISSLVTTPFYPLVGSVSSPSKYPLMGRNIPENDEVGKKLRETLAKNLQATMDRLGIRQEGVEERTGVAQSTVSRILLKQTPLSLDLLEDLARGLGIMSWELLVDDEETRAEVIRRYLRS
jgi:hypothetical protein